MNLQKKGFQNLLSSDTCYLSFQVGTWNEKTGVNFTRNFTESYSEIVESLQNKTLIVTTIYVSSKHGRFAENPTRWRCRILHSFISFLQSPPYSMYRDSQKRLTGNDVFEGYAIDLIKEVAEILSKIS